MNSSPKRICLISVEIFAYGKYGGFGKATRTIGGELVKRGYEVFAIIPRRPGQEAEEDLDGIKVLSYWPNEILTSGDLYRKVNADIYHSCEPSFGTYMAKKNVPHARHIATIRDPRNAYDWLVEFLYPSQNKWQVAKNYVYETNFLVRKTVRHCDGVFSPAHFLLPKIKKIYHLKQDPVFLPTPVFVPDHIAKSPTPQVLMLARMDPRKRPEIYLDLVPSFPNIHFHIAGKSRNPEYGIRLKAKYDLPNVTFHGFLDQFSSSGHHDLMEQSWILVNPALREGLPNTYLESAAHQCAILSYVNPDGFASEFGFHARKDNFEEGLSFLLKDNLWREKGLKGYQYVKDTFELRKAMDRHEEIYKKVFRSE